MAMNDLPLAALSAVDLGSTQRHLLVLAINVVSVVLQLNGEGEVGTYERQTGDGPCCASRSGGSVRRPGGKCLARAGARVLQYGRGQGMAALPARA